MRGEKEEGLDVLSMSLSPCLEVSIGNMLHTPSVLSIRFSVSSPVHFSPFHLSSG